MAGNNFLNPNYDLNSHMQASASLSRFVFLIIIRINLSLECLVCVCLNDYKLHIRIKRL